LPGFGYHQFYGTKDRPIEVLDEVRSGDVVLVPHGYNGPSVAAPGCHMYYLNVMASARSARPAPSPPTRWPPRRMW